MAPQISLDEDMTSIYTMSSSLMSMHAKNKLQWKDTQLLLIREIQIKEWENISHPSDWQRLKQVVKRNGEIGS